MQIYTLSPHIRLRPRVGGPTWPKRSFILVSLVALLIIGCGGPASESPADGVLPDGAAGDVPLMLVAHGFGQDLNLVGLSVIVENPDPDMAVADAGYAVRLLDADGQLLGEVGGRIALVPPGARLGVANEADVDSERTVAEMTVELRPGRAVTAPSELPRVEDERFAYDGTALEVWGTAVNPTAADLTRLRVSVVPYGPDGEITGGTYTHLERVPAGGRAPINTGNFMAQRPERVELYAEPPAPVE